jgi:CRP-like cAMP-binding protein
MTGLRKGQGQRDTGMSSAVDAPAQGPKFPALDEAVRALEGRVPEPLLALARSCGVPRRHDTGARLYAGGDAVTGLHVVVAGAVRVVRESGARAVVVHREGPGGVLGEVALFTDARYPATAIALEPTTTLLLPTADVHRALRAGGPLAEVLLRRLASRTREVIGRLDRLVHLTVARRLARHLAGRVDAMGRRDVSLGMTQVELAEELGTVKEIVVRELRALARRGLVAPLGRGRYAVADVEALRGFADS